MMLASIILLSTDCFWSGTCSRRASFASTGCDGGDGSRHYPTHVLSNMDYYGPWMLSLHTSSSLGGWWWR